MIVFGSPRERFLQEEVIHLLKVLPKLLLSAGARYGLVQNATKNAENVSCCEVLGAGPCGGGPRPCFCGAEDGGWCRACVRYRIVFRLLARLPSGLRPDIEPPPSACSRRHAPNTLRGDLGGNVGCRIDDKRHSIDRFVVCSARRISPRRPPVFNRRACARRCQTPNHNPLSSRPSRHTSRPEGARRSCLGKGERKGSART